MKKFTLKILIFAVFIGLVIIPFNVCVDPFNIFHADNVRDNGVEPDKNYIKTRYVLKHKDEYDSYLFGSSRAGFYDVTRLPDGSWYNMCYSEALPKEQTYTLKALIDGGEIPERVILTLDNISFLIDPAEHENTLYRKAYPYDKSFYDKFLFYASYLDTVTSIDSLKVINAHEGDDEALRARLYSTGCEDLSRVKESSEDDFNNPYWADYYKPRVEEALNDVKEFKALCDQYDIELTVMTNPIYIKTYEKSVDKGYLEFLDGLADITTFYNFSGYNRISQYEDYYYETSHFTTEAGNEVIDRMLRGEIDNDETYGTGFGFYVKPETKEDFMTIMYLQAYVTGVLEYKE